MAETAEANAALITKFYTAFAAQEGQTIADMYTADATFSDPVFTGLKGSEVGSMWKMLTGRAKDFSLTFSNVKGTATGGSADWIAKYLYGGKNMVENHVHAEFTIVDGKITTHKDAFDFYTWSRQALGVPGVLLGWTPFMQNTIRKKAKEQLHKYMEKH